MKNQFKTGLFEGEIEERLRKTLAKNILSESESEFVAEASAVLQPLLSPWFKTHYTSHPIWECRVIGFEDPYVIVRICWGWYGRVTCALHSGTQQVFGADDAILARYPLATLKPSITTSAERPY